MLNLRLVVLLAALGSSVGTFAACRSVPAPVEQKGDTMLIRAWRNCSEDVGRHCAGKPSCVDKVAERFARASDSYDAMVVLKNSGCRVAADYYRWLQSGPNCSTGCRCGNTCISCSYQCHTPGPADAYYAPSVFEQTTLGCFGP